MTYAEMFARVRDWCERSTVESKRIRPTDRQKRPYCEVSQDGTSTLVRPPQRMKVTTGADTVCENQIKRATRTVRAPPHETKVWSCWPESSSVESGRFTLCTEPKRPNVEASQGAPSIPERPSQGGKMTIDAEEKGPENGKSSQRSPGKLKLLVLFKSALDTVTVCHFLCCSYSSFFSLFHSDLVLFSIQVFDLFLNAYCNVLGCFYNLSWCLLHILY